MPLAAKKKNQVDPAALYVAWESFGTPRPDLTIRAGTKLRGDHEAVQTWPQYFLPADTPENEIDAHRRAEYAAEIEKVQSSSRQKSELEIRVLEAAKPLRDEDCVVAIRTTGLTAQTAGLAIDPTNQLRTVHAGQKVRRDDPLVKHDPDSFRDVCNGIPRERAVEALQQVGNVDENGPERIERTIYAGQWADLDDRLVMANPHGFRRVGFE